MREFRTLDGGYPAVDDLVEVWAETVAAFPAIRERNRLALAVIVLEQPRTNLARTTLQIQAAAMTGVIIADALAGGTDSLDFVADVDPALSAMVLLMLAFLDSVWSSTAKHPELLGRRYVLTLPARTWHQFLLSPLPGAVDFVAEATRPA